MTFARRRTQKERRKNVLLVDSDRGSAKVVSWMLAQSSHAVKHHHEATKALQAFKKNPGGFEVVIVSARLPGTTGFEFARSIRKVRSDIRIILLTDFKINRSEFRKVFPSSQIDDMVVKPVVMRHLLQAITGPDGWHADADATEFGGVGEYQNALR